jgi:hypothetical protein
MVDNDTNSRGIRHLRELIEAEQRAQKEALALQAKEYERRLDELNHAHARALQAAQMSVSRELYESDKRIGDERREAISKEIETIRREVGVDLARRAGRAEMLSVLAVILSLLSPLIIKVFFP